MKKSPSSALRALAFTWTYISVLKLFLLHPAALFLLFLLSLLPVSPALFESLLILSLAAPLSLIFIILLLSFTSIVQFDSDQITLRMLGIPVRRLNLSEISLMCAVGNHRDSVLCFAARPIEDMAADMEKRLQKSWLLRHEAYFRRKKPDWQDSFARDYLLRLMNTPFGPFRSREVIMVPLDPILAHRLRSLYPHLPYRNYTLVPVQPSSYHYRANQPYESVLYAANQLKISEDGILLFNAKENLFLLPAGEIQTIVRADRFVNSDKYRAHHPPLLIVTRLTESELARRAPARLCAVHASAPDASSLLAAAYCLLQACRWNIKNHDFVPVICTQNNIDSLRTFCPHAHWIDLSDSWLIDRNPHEFPSEQDKLPE